MSDEFVHLRVASGYSLQYGASHPSALVARAADFGMDTLALTDRDGLYGAVRFAKACMTAGLAPVIGADFSLGVSPLERGVGSSRVRTPVRGGVARDPRAPRAVVLARSRAGWAALCRLTSQVHLSGERGKAIADREQIARFAADGELVVLLGADSEIGLALAAGREDLALAELDHWRDLVAPEQLVLAATSHDIAGSGVGSLDQAAGLVALADRQGLEVVLTNSVRMAERRLAPTLDVLDAARRLAPLDLTAADRRNAEGWLKPGKDMLLVAERVAQRAGRGAAGAARLVADTRRLALRCRLDPRQDIGLGEIHLPEFSVLGVAGAGEALQSLRARCESGAVERYGRMGREVTERLESELDVISQLGFSSYFLTVADVVGLVRDLGIRCAARGSGAGSLVNYTLGISGVDPLRYGLIMERFLSPLRQALPDIDLDVESARRTEVYSKILETFGGERVACVAMLDTYRVRHAVRDVGAALSLPPGEIDAIAKAFPHIRARDARAALRDLPELRAAGLGERRFDLLFSLVESLDGLPRHIALHPCGVLLSDSTLLDRTPVEASYGGFPMSQFDKDDVEDLGLLKLDVLGIRMQSALAHALGEVRRTEGREVDIDALDPFDDPATYELIGNAATLGCFQIESPGQRELVGKFGPATFNDIVIDISLFRPGPVKSDMVTPFLEARQGWREASYIHPDLEPALAESGGVVVFHEQVIKVISIISGCSLAEADEARRALGDKAGQQEVKDWFVPLALSRGYSAEVVERVWSVLEAFASFGFCKAHAAAFALPTYQSAWMKTHYPAHFLAGVLTHDPGMYPKRLILEEARRCGVAVLSLDVNASGSQYLVERFDPGETLESGGRLAPERGLPDGRGWGIRLSLADVKGISATEIERVVAGRPYRSLSDFFKRSGVEAPVVESLVLAGAFDAIYGIGRSETRRRGGITRRDLLLAVADLARADRVDSRTRTRARGLRSVGLVAASSDPRDLARQQSRQTLAPAGQEVQLALDFTAEDEACDLVASGLPEMSDSERMAAELAILGLDASSHVVQSYLPLLQALGVCFSRDLLRRRNASEQLIAGVKVATQTPPVRSGRRVIFLTLDDTTGPVDATFFEDVQGPYAATVFSSWLLLVRGVVRRTGPRGISLRATGCWDLPALQAVWDQTLSETGDEDAALRAVREALAVVPEGFGPVGEVLPQEGGEAVEPVGGSGPGDPQRHSKGGGMGRRRVLVHPSGFTQSPYADVRPAGVSPSEAPRKLWHSSPGSSGA